MKKVILSLTFMLVTMLSGNAAGPTLTINGKTVEKTVTKITFEGDNAVLHFGNETEAHDMNSVVLSFSALSGIDEIISYSFNGIIDGNIVLGGIPTGTVVEIYDTTGKLRVSEKIESDPANIDITSLNKGIYLLKAGKNCVKFQK
ncbi:MAG: T9SS type A sorting domain-containing protein [Lachnospiraceae bacterium]|nr:T9SS type A sorting domain-containing protein [Lachnospiraceae bacterium]